MPRPGTKLIHLDELARTFERHFGDECVITKEGAGDSVYNEETLEYDDPPRETVYEGKCLVTTGSAAERIAEAAGALVTLKGYVILVPRGETEIREGHRVEITSTADDALLNEHLWVNAAVMATNVPARVVIADFQQQEE